MVMNDNCNFKRGVEEQNSEGTVYQTYEPTLSDIKCNLQEDDAFISHQPYGHTDFDDTFVLFVEKQYQPYISRGDIVEINEERYRVEKVIKSYTTHLELLLKSTVNNG